MTSSKSRMIFGNEVTTDMTLLIECDGTSCRYPGEHGPTVDHEAKIVQLRMIEDMGPRAVLEDTSGNQHGWMAGWNTPARILTEAAASTVKADKTPAVTR